MIFSILGVTIDQFKRCSRIRSLWFLATCARTQLQRWIVYGNYLVESFGDLFTRYCQSVTGIETSTILVCLKSKSSLLYMAIDGTAFNTSMAIAMGYANMCNSLPGWHGKKCWTLTEAFGAIVYSFECISALQEICVDGSKMIDMISSLDFPCSCSFFMDNIAFHIRSVK